MKVETKQKLEEWANQNLDILVSADSLTKEELDAAKDEVKTSLTMLKEIEEAEAKSADAEERRKLEEKKTAETLQIERDKTKFSWKHFAADCGKTVGVAYLSYWLYRKLQEAMFTFEKDGYVASSAGKQLRLPNPSRWMGK